MCLIKGKPERLFNVRACHGAPGRIRTRDPLVRSQVLYPTELPAHSFVKFLNEERHYI